VDCGDLRRLTPLSRCFGFDRGKPVDRYYIENFLASRAGDVRGRVLEIADKMFLHCRIYVTDLVLDRYRQHDGSCCAQAERNKDYNPEGGSPAQKRFLLWLERYLSAQRVRDPVVSKALREALWPYRHPFLQRVRAWCRDPRGAAGRLWRRWWFRQASSRKSGSSSPAEARR
jgi:hypothetical protein